MKDSEENYSKIKSWINLKIHAGQCLSIELGVSANDIFYKYINGEILNTGCLNNIEYFFHGLGCSVKNRKEGWSVDLEFGPLGSFYAFDKFTFCYEFKSIIKNNNNFFDELLKNGVIESALPYMEKILIRDKNFQGRSGKEIETDKSVNDRFVFVCPCLSYPNARIT